MKLNSERGVTLHVQLMHYMQEYLPEITREAPTASSSDLDDAIFICPLYVTGRDRFGA